ncbi:MAG TPA: hypothetical protein VKO84_05480 [Gaiellaceae bacterium]|nr:hypothetical protein [Gaiellaceae bacterium]
MKRLVFLIVVVLALTACGGSSKSKTPPETGPSPASTKRTITNNWEQFFSSKTNVAGKVRLMQNGEHFKSVIQSFASNPLASNVSAAVSSVTIQGANKAKVVYVVTFGGASLPKQTGIAVRENGSWKVGDASLCKLIALGGTTPSVCKS